MSAQFRARRSVLYMPASNLKAIEKVMGRIVKEGQTFRRWDVTEEEAAARRCSFDHHCIPLPHLSFGHDLFCPCSQ